MRLSALLAAESLSIAPISDIEVGKPCADSRTLTKKDVFFSENGADYVRDAIEKGASAIVIDEKTPLPALPIPVFRVKHTKKAYAHAWQAYTEHPERHLRLFAVTGTNGKTSTAHFLAEIFRFAGKRVGTVGTVGNDNGIDLLPSSYTTPPPEILYPLFKTMCANDVTHVVMEASSHAIDQYRLEGLVFETAIFTNLTRDHLDYHGTEAIYRDTKARLFRQAKMSLLNLDDPNAAYMAQKAFGEVRFYAKEHDADIRIQDVICSPEDIRYTLCIGEDIMPLTLPLTGGFHVYNSAAAISCAYFEGIPLSTLIKAANDLRAPCGRLEKLKTDTPYAVYIDYAHTPDALKQALSTLRSLTKHLTVLFGAGGDRDTGKRPEMGRAADMLADRILLTSDNPRTESPSRIISDIRAGILKTPTVAIPDRKEAIEYALATAKDGEIILLAGKGHETYLIDQNGKHPFSERDILYQYLESKGQNHVSEHP